MHDNFREVGMSNYDDFHDVKVTFFQGFINEDMSKIIMTDFSGN